jgi:hypothetical protein
MFKFRTPEEKKVAIIAGIAVAVVAFIAIVVSL